VNVRTAPTPSRVRPRLLAGGTRGNELLTAVNGAVLLVLLAVEGVTIVFLGPLLSVHLFVGVLLLPPVVLKLGSTGYRFVRYYARTRAYRRKGPPVPALRLIAPVLVATTVAVFASGTVLLLGGPSTRGTFLQIHKVTFFVWLGAFGVHLVGHLPTLGRALRADFGRRSAARVHPDGAAGRRIALAGALVLGLALAVAVLPDFGAWLHYQQFRHHH
jgi:hypothetical protein